MLQLHTGQTFIEFGSIAFGDQFELVLVFAPPFY